LMVGLHVVAAEDVSFELVRDALAEAAWLETGEETVRRFWNRIDWRACVGEEEDEFQGGMPGGKEVSGEDDSCFF
jgi:hypothetical protein